MDKERQELLDQFALQAMHSSIVQGRLASNEYALATYCYKIAQAMLHERETLIKKYNGAS